LWCLSGFEEPKTKIAAEDVDTKFFNTVDSDASKIILKEKIQAEYTKVSMYQVHCLHMKSSFISKMRYIFAVVTKKQKKVAMSQFGLRLEVAMEHPQWT
jgi:hypothetical protein